MPNPLSRLLDAARERYRDGMGPRRRRQMALTRVALRVPSASLRKLPDFLILGAQRCGTSSLFQYLTGHPGVKRPIRKEITYFSSSWSNGPQWYRSHFPLRVDPRLTFEATPDYLFDPRAPSRVLSTLGPIPMIVLLRDPVERAWSHYGHMKRLGFEKLSFEEALDAESTRLAGAWDGAEPEKAVWRYSYAARGRYADQLERWQAVFPRQNMMVVEAERLYADPGAVLDEVNRFVGLSEWRPAEFRNWSYAGAPVAKPGSSRPMPPAARERLMAEFADSNRRLPALLGWTPDWAR
jgi:hypothetical protein